MQWKIFKKVYLRCDRRTTALGRWMTNAGKQSSHQRRFDTKKALAFAVEKGITDFCVSGGWRSRFKARHNLCHKSISSEEGDMNTASVDQWRKEALPILLNGYTDNQIYNGDETGLYYQCLPNKTLHFCGLKCTVGKRSKNCISCTNKSGTDKLKPLVIGKSKNPWCFKNVRRPHRLYKQPEVLDDIGYFRGLSRRFRCSIEAGKKEGNSIDWQLSISSRTASSYVNQSRSEVSSTPSIQITARWFLVLLWIFRLNLLRMDFLN